MIFFFQQWVREDMPDALAVPSTKPLYEQIDFGRLVPIEKSLRVDRAADGIHPGPRSQVVLADRAWEVFRAQGG